MEQTKEDIGSKISNTTPVQDNQETTVASSHQSAAPEGGQKKRDMTAKGMQKTLSNTSMLANFLPTGTLLAFEMIIPSVYGDDNSCTHLSTMIMVTLLVGLCSLSCFFFHFTDSVRALNGEIYYGFVTPKGLVGIKADVEPRELEKDRYKLSFIDFVHGIMSVIVFLAIAFSDHRVTQCVFPEYEKEMNKVMECFALMVGFVCSTLFFVFPSTRYSLVIVDPSPRPNA